MAIIESRLETEKSYENPDFGVKELADIVHQWFVEDFGREPSESPEDLEWLTDHMLNFNNYAYNR